MTGARRRESSPCVCRVFFSFSIYLHSSPQAAGRAAGIMRCCNVDEAHPAYRSISINVVHVQTKTPRRFIRCGLISARACLIRPAYLHGCSCLFGPMGLNLDKTDSVYRGLVYVCEQVNAL